MPDYYRYLFYLAPVSIIDLTLNETCLKEGSNAAICCNIQGFPRPTIQFQLDDQTVIPGATEFENYVLEYYNQVHKPLIYALALR